MNQADVILFVIGCDERVTDLDLQVASILRRAEEACFVGCEQDR